MSHIHVLTSEGQSFSIPRDIASQSLYIQKKCEEIGESSCSKALELNVSSFIFQKVIAYAEHHRGDPQYVEDRVSFADIDEWDKTFMDVDNDTLFKLISAATHLEMKPLIDLACRTLAQSIMSKSAEEVRELYGINNDFTEEELAAIKNEI
ncbi:SconCp [Cladochytrium replicatum]|nr:SconCp [Cladochytrium replicatum]